MSNSWKANSRSLIQKFPFLMWRHSRSRWSCGLRCMSAGARLLGSRVWIPPGLWTFFMLCIVYAGDSAIRWSLVQRSPTGCVYLIACDLENSKRGCLCLSGAVALLENLWRQNFHNSAHRSLLLISYNTDGFSLWFQF